MQSFFPPGAFAVEAGGLRLLLLPQRAAFHPGSHSLMVADLHLGKAATFRAFGVPVPSGTTERTFARLDALLASSKAHALYLLGDLLHGPKARRRELFEALARWRERHRAVEVVLVRGNHDARAGDPPAGCGIAVVDPGLRVAGLRLLHEPAPRGEDGAPARACERGQDCDYSLAGHLHPVWRLNGRVDSVRLPCFWLRPRCAVLPAFGEFTGGWPVRAEAGDRIFVSDGESVRAVPSRGLASP